MPKTKCQLISNLSTTMPIFGCSRFLLNQREMLASLSVWCRSQWKTLMFERRQSAPTRPLKFFHSLTNCSICNLAGKVKREKWKHPDTSWYVQGRIYNEEKPLTWKAHSSKTSNWKLFSISVLYINRRLANASLAFPLRQFLDGIENTLWQENCFPLSFQCIEAASRRSLAVCSYSDPLFCASNPSKEQKRKHF